MKRIPRYLQGTIQRGVIFKPSFELVLIEFTDIDWGFYPDDKRFMYGVCIFLGENPMFWSSKKEKVIARSSIEVKYQALAYIATRVIWLQALLKEMHLVSSSVPI